MRRFINRFCGSLGLSILGIMAVTVVVAAQATYTATYVVTEENGNDYDMLAVTEAVDNQWLADNGFIQADALGTRIQTLAGAVKPHMVVDDRTQSAIPVPADSQTNLYFTTGNSDLDAMDIIPGYDGYITITDDAEIESGDGFEYYIDDGYIDTDSGSDKNLLDKDNCIRTFVNGSTDEEIDTEIWELINQDLGATGAYNVIPAASQAQTFLTFDGPHLLTSISCYGTGNNSNVDCDIYATDATGAPTGASLTDATTLCVAALQWHVFDVTDYLLDANTLYAIVLTTADVFAWNYQNGDPYTRGASWTGPVWAENVGDDNAFRAYVRPRLVADSVSSGELGITVRGDANNPIWASGDVIAFDGTANSSIDYGAIYNAATKLWISLWFKLDATHSAGSGQAFLFGKRLDGTNLLYLSLINDGRLLFQHLNLGVYVFEISTPATSWTGGEWYHVIASISSVNGARLVVDGTAYTDADNTALFNGGNLVVGESAVAWANGISGQMQNIITGTDDLTQREERDLLYGIAPGDEVDYWYLNEGTGDISWSFGSSENNGDLNANSDWATSTYTTGESGRWCDFSIDIDGDRWGQNLKGYSVDDTGDNIRLMDNNTTPFFSYMDAYRQSGRGLVYDGTANSEVDCGAIYSASAKLWISLWFKLDTSYYTGVGDEYIFGKRVDGSNYTFIYLNTANGRLYFTKYTGGAPDFTVYSAETSWQPGTWYHVMASISSANGVRLRIDNGTAVTDADTSAVTNGGNFVLGDRNVALGSGIIGQIANVAVGTDDLTTTEETSLYNGIIPSDATDYWLADEGAGAVITSYGTAGNNGAAGASTTWGYTGSSGVGVARIWYEPNTMIIGTALPDREANAHNGVFTFGANPAGVDVVMGSMVSVNQPIPGLAADDPARDVLPETPVTDWYVEPDVTGSLLTNPIRPLVTMLSDNSQLSEMQVWRLYGIIFVLMVTVLTLRLVRRHFAIAGFACGAANVAMVALTIFPPWALVFTVGTIIAGLVGERTPSL